MRSYAITVRGGDAAYRVITRAENGTFTTPHFFQRDGKRKGKTEGGGGGIENGIFFSFPALHSNGILFSHVMRFLVYIEKRRRRRNGPKELEGEREERQLKLI